MPTMPGAPGKPDQKMCPFLGMVAIPEVHAPAIQSISREPEMKIGIRFNVCVEEKCLFWDVAKKCCTIKSGMDSIIALRDIVDQHKGKLSFLSMFGGKKE